MSKFLLLILPKMSWNKRVNFTEADSEQTHLKSIPAHVIAIVHKTFFFFFFLKILKLTSACSYWDTGSSQLLGQDAERMQIK